MFKKETDMDYQALYTTQKQADVVMRVICEENDAVTEVNYYSQSALIVKEHFSVRGVSVSDSAVYYLVRNAVMRMIEMMPDPKGFIEISSSREMFALLQLVLADQLKKL